jgi:hypothetical protein
MSSKRLKELSSNCSLDFLLTNVERFTVKIRLCVGSGIGPLTTAPVALTVFTIFSADLSTRLWSYDFSLILIFWLIAITAK